MSLKDFLDVADQDKQSKLKRAVPSVETSSYLGASCNQERLRPLIRPNYCQTKKRGKNIISERSNAEMCQKGGIEEETQPENVSSGRHSCLSPFVDDCEKDNNPAIKVTTSGYTETSVSEKEEFISSSDKAKEDAINEYAAEPSTPSTSYSDEENQSTSSVFKNKKNKQSAEIKCLCDKLLLNPHEYTLHLKEEHTKIENNSYICMICDKQLSSQSSLDRHLLIHSGERPYTCETCGETFTTNGNMNRHMRIHDKKKNSRSNSRSGSAVKKQKKCHLNDDKASISNIEDKSELKQPIHEYDRKTSISSTEDLIRGLKFIIETEHEIKIKNPIIHKCIDCIYGFDDLTHMAFTSKNFPLTARLDCEKRRRCPFDKRDLKEIDASASSNFNLPKVCDTCELSFPCQRSLDLHLSAHLHKDSLICKICKGIFPSIQQFQLHELLSHKDPVNKMKSSDSERMKHDFMHALGLVDRKRAKLDNEEPKHTKYTSEISMIENMKNEASSTDKEILALHAKPDCQSDISNDFADISSIVSLASKSSIPNIRTSPITATPASPQCEDQIPVTPALPQSSGEFSSTPSLSQSTEHLPETYTAFESSCHIPESSSSLQTSDQLSESPLEKATNSLQVSGIEIDNSSFKADLNVQKVNNELINNKNSKSTKSTKHSKKTMHKCQKCNYTSLDKSTLSRHMRTHNGERPFKCKICGYAFTTKANTHRHVKHRHGISSAEAHLYAIYNSTKSTAKASVDGINDNALYYCQFCKGGFDNARVLQHHLRSTSSSCPRKPYFCKRCNSGFTTKNNCTRHINNQHPDCNVNQLIQINKLQSRRENKSEGLAGEILSLSDIEASNDHDETEHLSINLEDSIKEEQESQESLNEITDIEMETSSKEEIEVNEDISLMSSNNSISEDIMKQKSETYSDSTVEQKLLNQTSLVYPKLNTSDEVYAIDGLMSLSKTVSFQKNDNNEPLDLSVRPVDLSTKKIETQNSDSPASFECIPSILQKNFLSKVQPTCTSTFMPFKFTSEIINSSQTSNSEPINLSNTSPSLPFCSTPCSSAVNSVPKNLHKFEEIFNKKTSSKKDIECQYCYKRFSNKSNKERHIKNQHSKYIQSAKNNLVHVPAMPELQKQAQKVSDTTKNRLRSVLIPKVNNSNIQNLHDDDSCGSEPALCIVENMITDSSNENSQNEDISVKSVSKSDYENNDLASISSVIDTACSPKNTQYYEGANVADIHASHSIGNHAVQSNMNRNPCRKMKQYTCEVCAQTFSSSSAKERHMTTHTGEKNFACSQCGNRYSTKSNRDRHVKKKCCSKNSNRPQNQHSDKLESLGNESSHDGYTQHKNLSELNGTLSNRPSQISQSILNPFDYGHPSFHLNTSMYVPLQSFAMKQELECKICNNTYKNNDDLTNHLKELHPLEYKTLVGETVHPEDTIVLLKRSSLMKKSLFNAK